MKKLSKIFGIIACAFVLVVSGVMLTACGGSGKANPYSIKGVTLKGTSECIIVWGENATQADKEELWTQLGATNDKEFEQKYSEMAGEFYKSWTCVFKNDGSVEVTMTEHEEPETETWYFTQTEDLKTIQTYYDAELTDKFLPFDFIDGKYCLSIVPDSDYDISIYFAFAKS